MLLPQLLDTLGYQDNPNFLTGNKLTLDFDHAHLYRRAQVEVAGGGCSLQGVYALRAEIFDQSAQSVPVVYVCEAKTEDEANCIHNRVWNQSIVPFLIVCGPRFVRLYSGFKYTKSHTDNGLLKPLSGLNEAASALKAFSAQSIDHGLLWSDWGQAVTPETRVDWKLLESLQDLDQELQKAGVGDRDVSHSLIGTFVYLRYLKDRDILSSWKLETWGIELESVFSRKASLKAFYTLLDHLRKWLNGEVFPLPEGSRKTIRKGHIQLLAGTFYGDRPASGQLSLFDAYDFSFIPIETLSVIYEQFLHAKPGTTGREQGAYYTPMPIVSYMVEKLEERKPLRRGVRVLDPSCGSGAFLVYAYRKLIEKLRAKNGGVRPKLTELRELLTEHIFGADIDPEACCVAELSLILTLLDYANPPDLSATSFKLPALRGRNIFRGDFFDESSPWFGGQKYDWVIGNPPWTTIRSTDASTQNTVAYRWIVEHKLDRPTGGNQLAEAFAWRVTDVAKQDGVVGLLMPAMTLFKDESRAFRRAFFQENQLWSVTNFSNLAEVLFGRRSRVPAAALLYSPGREPANGDSEPHRVEVYSPLVANRLSHLTGKKKRRTQTWNLVVDASEIRDVPYRRISEGDGLSWKLAAWGSEADRKLLSSLQQRGFQKLRDLENNGRLFISKGLELRTKNAEKALEHHPKLAGTPMLDMEKLRGCRRVFVFPEEAIVTLPETRAYCRKGRYRTPMRVCQPPHIIVSKARTFAVFTDRPLIVPPGQVGILGDT